MSLKIKKSSGAGVHIDEGEYLAVIESIQVNKWQDGNESYGFTFKVKDATLDGDPLDGHVRIKGFASAILTPKSKLFKWAKGAGLDVENEDEIDLEDAVGKAVRISVEDGETKEGATISKVDKVRPAKKRKKSSDGVEDKPAKKKNDSKVGKKKTKVDEDEDEDEEEEEEEEEEEKPKKAKGKEKSKEKKKAKKAVDDDDDEDDEELFNFTEDEDEDEDD